MSYKITISHSLLEGINIVKVKGFMDISNFALFEETLESLIQKNTSKIILDFTDLDYISSAGLGTILSHIRRARQLKGDIIVRGCSSAVRNILEIFGFTQVFPVAASPQAAVELFKKA